MSSPKNLNYNTSPQGCTEPRRLMMVQECAGRMEFSRNEWALSLSLSLLQDAWTGAVGTGGRDGASGANGDGSRGRQG